MKMLVCKVVAAILFMRLSNAQENLYRIPQPTIEVFNPERFRISIEDSAGITSVAFHININEDIKQVGEFYKELRHPHQGRWTFEVPNAHLNVGDTIYYQLVVVNDKIGYRKLGTYFMPSKTQNGTFEASDAQPIQPLPNQNQLQPENCKGCLDELQPMPTTSPSSPENNRDTSLNTCQEFLFNTTQHLLGLQSQLEDVRKSNQQLIDILEKYPDSKTLTLTAKIPPTNDPAMTVRFFIREKLNLNPDIISAVYVSDNSIEFKVANIVEKVEILKAAKTTLVDSKFTIS